MNRLLTLFFGSALLFGAGTMDTLYAQSLKGMALFPSSSQSVLLRPTPTQWRTTVPLQLSIGSNPAKQGRLTPIILRSMGDEPPLTPEQIKQFCADQAGGETFKHYAISLVGTLGLQYVLEQKLKLSKPTSLILSALGGFSLGLIQERADWNNTARNCFRPSDLWASAGGVLTGSFVILVF